MLADWVTVSLEAAAAVEAESEAAGAVAFEAFAPSHWEAALERTRLFRVWGGCLRDGAWGAGL